MKINRKKALMTALLLSVVTFTSCGTNQPASSAPSDVPEISSSINDDGIIEGSFGTVAGQSLPEAMIPEKPEGCTHLTDKNGFIELQHSVHEANSKDAIFKKHISQTITMNDTYEHLYDMCDYVYLAQDHSYGSTSYYQQYSKDRIVYQLVGMDTSSPFTAYVADLTEDYTGHVYWYVPQDFDDYYDAGHETITEVYVNGDTLWQYSVVDENGSKEYLSGKMGGEYGGEIIHCFEIVDSKSYELIEAHAYAEKDGKTYLLGIHKMEYDLSEPEEVSSFLKNFDNGSDETATVTYVANPGKDNEITKSMEVPLYSSVTFYSQDIPEADVFLDAECTKHAGNQWDGKSEITYYVVPKMP